MRVNLKNIISNKLLFTGIIVFTALIILSVMAPLLSPHDPFVMKAQPLKGPSISHLLGTNDSGQDILSELLYSIQNSISFGLIAAFTALFFGVLIGCSSAFSGGLFDLFMMRVADAIIAVPMIMILILISATIKPAPYIMAAILGLIGWPPIARGIRAQCLSIQEKHYIKSVRHLGGGFFYILRKHIIPEIFPLFIIGFSTKMRVAVIMEATLAFLGLIDPGRKSLGLMINYSMKYYYLDVWSNWIIPPLVILSSIILSVTFIAIGMETVFSLQLKKITRIRDL